MERPCRCSPLIKRLFPPSVSLSPSLPFPPCIAPRARRGVGIFPLYARGRASVLRLLPPFFRPPRVALFRCSPFYWHAGMFALPRLAEWPAGSGTYVGFMNFICSDKTMRIYSRQACRQFGRIFIGEKGYFFLALLPALNGALRYVDRNGIEEGKRDNWTRLFYISGRFGNGRMLLVETNVIFYMIFDMSK